MAHRVPEAAGPPLPDVCAGHLGVRHAPHVGERGDSSCRLTGGHGPLHGSQALWTRTGRNIRSHFAIDRAFGHHRDAAGGMADADPIGLDLWVANLSPSS